MDYTDCAVFFKHKKSSIREICEIRVSKYLGEK